MDKNTNTEMIKLFQTPSGEYFVFDGRTSRIITVGSGLLRETAQETEAAVMRYLAEQGIASPEPMEKIEWLHDFEAYIERIRHEIPGLLLQITRRCNLDCEYCVYSGNYSFMSPHANQDMSLDTVLKSIDFFAKRNTRCKEATIDFYGGEALLRLDLLKEAVSYAEKAIVGKPLKFRITSNGVLLNEEVMQWMEEHPNIFVTVTVNGPYHDRHRKTVSGQGSLHRIMNNISHLKQAHPHLWEKQILFIANVAHPNHIPALGRFYMEELGKAPASITYIRGQNGNEKIQKIISEEHGAKMTEERLIRSYCETCDPFLDAYFGNSIRGLHNRVIYKNDQPGLIGSCMPSLEKLFVHCDGRFGICESACDKVIIGDLDNGYDIQTLRQIYNEALELYNRSCRNCWAQRLCTVCFKDIYYPDGTTAAQIPEEFCMDSRAYTLNRLRMYCEIAVHHPQRLSQYITSNESRVWDDDADCPLAE